MPTYVISVPGTRPRDAVRDRLRDLRDVRFFDGVDGAALEQTGTLKPGEAGCAASHMRLWARLLAAGAPALVFEDDARPAPGFPERLADVLPHVGEDVDVVFLGHCAEGRGALVAPGLRRSVHPRCTHAYLLTPRGVLTLARWAARTPVHRLPTPIDEELAGLIGRGELRALSCDPPIVGTSDEDSLIDRLEARWPGDD